jgi:tRNA pseudouridine(55) synthase
MKRVRHFIKDDEAGMYTRMKYEKNNRKKCLTLYKQEGETPLACLERFRIENPLYKDAVLSYAGRLDPMAEGALLVLVDEENKKRADYLNLDKIYEVEILLGVSTDTGDILGIVNENSEGGRDEEGGAEEKVKNTEEILNTFIGSHAQKYPHYSSRTVQGKPLFQWAREGRIKEVEIPKKEIKIHKIEMVGRYEIENSVLLQQTKKRIEKVKGDFRQDEIIASWERFSNCHKSAVHTVLLTRVECSSGTYMRTLAENIAHAFGTRGIALKIKRLQYLF